MLNPTQTHTLSPELIELFKELRRDAWGPTVDCVEKLVLIEISLAEQRGEARALDTAKRFYLDQPVGTKPPTVVNEEMYKRILRGELDEAITKKGTDGSSLGKSL